MLRYGLIGSGMMGQEHIRNVALLDGAAVTAVADPDEGMRDGARTLAGCDAAYADYRDMLSAGDCDAFVIAAPNDTHHGILVDVLAAGKPVLCEKPLCTTTAHCDEVVALAARSAAPVWVAMEYRYMPPTEQLIGEVAAGVVGAPMMIAIREHRYPFLTKVGDWNRFNRRTGGTFVEKCCHYWDLMRLILKSDPVRVFASGGIGVNHLDERYDGETPDIIDHGFVVVDFASGARGMLDLCMFGEGSTWQEIISVTGPKARVEAVIPRPERFAPDHMVPSAQIIVSDRASMRAETRDVWLDPTLLHAGDHYGSTFFQHRRFRDMVRHGGRPEVTLEDGLWAVRVGEAAEHSARSGEAVAL